MKILSKAIFKFIYYNIYALYVKLRVCLVKLVCRFREVEVLGWYLQTVFGWIVNVCSRVGL